MSMNYPSEPGELLATITAGDVDFVYESRVRGGTVSNFEPGMAIAAMLRCDVLLIHDHWWREDLPESERNKVGIGVLCSDVFMWACAETEPLTSGQIENLYRMWRRDTEWGPAVWCCQQRKEMPQAPVAKLIKEAGIWDLSTMGLAENQYDTRCRERFGKS